MYLIFPAYPLRVVEDTGVAFVLCRNIGTKDACTCTEWRLQFRRGAICFETERIGHTGLIGTRHIRGKHPSELSVVLKKRSVKWTKLGSSSFRALDHAPAMADGASQRRTRTWRRRRRRSTLHTGTLVSTPSSWESEHSGPFVSTCRTNWFNRFFPPEAPDGEHHFHRWVPSDLVYTHATAGGETL